MAYLIIVPPSGPGVAVGTSGGGTSTAPELVQPFSRSGVLSASAGAGRWIAPAAGTLIGMILIVRVAPTGQPIIADLNKNGTTVFTTQANRPRIVAGATTSTSIITPDVTAFAQFDAFSVDIDQVGTTGNEGQDITAEMLYRLS